MELLTFDIGTTAVKGALWDETRVACSAKADVATTHPEPGWSEQEPSDWWHAVSRVCQALRDSCGERALDEVCAVSFSAARETFVPVSGPGAFIGRAILWSDRRAEEEAARLTEALGAEKVHQRTGAIVDAGSVAAKVAWMARCEPEKLGAAKWLLSPRDAVVMHMTGEAVTDSTVASRSGLYDLGGRPVADLAGPALGLLPPVTDPTSVAGEVLEEPATELGVREGTPVVTGAGDRACEALGAGASPAEPVVSWGTTTNASRPVREAPSPVPKGLCLSRGALSGYLLEAGLSASGQALSWLAELTGWSVGRLATEAADVEPGARGLIALPWLNGARAPWWAPGATGGITGLTTSHGPADLARALIEAVAYDVQRSLALMTSDNTRLVALRAVGGGSASKLWLEILAAVTSFPVAEMRVAEAASAGAFLIGARAMGVSTDEWAVNCVTEVHEPSPSLRERYAELQPRADRAALDALFAADGGGGV